NEENKKDFGNEENKKDYGNEENKKDYGNEENKKDYGNEENKKDYGNEENKKDYGNEENKQDHEATLIQRCMAFIKTHNSMLQGRIKEYQARNLRRFNVVSPYRPELCQPIFDQFISEYLPKAERNWLDNGQKITQVHDPCIVICLHSSRAPEDVNLTLQKLFISDIQVLIVGIQPCEKTIKPSSLLKYNLKSRIKDIRVYDFTDIVFSDTTEKCYLSDINVDAVDDISRFCGQQTNTSTVMPDNSSRKYETTKKKDIAMVKDSYSSDSNAYVHEGESHARDIDNCSMFEEGNAEIATSQRENYELHCPKPNDNQLNNASSSLQQPMNQTTEKTNIKCSKDQKSITKMDSQVNGIV
ncbi:uncharacterized protein LOC134260922, partial [Saccostrea cucullata]|uniref:uncharacterized protein LOC134260922 n=1 Tax=Saccostrea cuccullata TaxID=36930 RepID=UPI002ED27CED